MDLYTCGHATNFSYTAEAVASLVNPEQDNAVGLVPLFHEVPHSRDFQKGIPVKSASTLESSYVVRVLLPF